MKILDPLHFRYFPYENHIFFWVFEFQIITHVKYGTQKKMKEGGQLTMKSDDQ